jgi:hypothetical protein
MFPNQKPRPYVVTFKLPSGELVHARVTAFDLQEAMLQGNIRLAARGVAKPMFMEVAPDVAAIKAEEHAQQANRSVEAISDAARLSNALNRYFGKKK